MHTTSNVVKKLIIFFNNLCLNGDENRIVVKQIITKTDKNKYIFGISLWFTFTSRVDNFLVAVQNTWSNMTYFLKFHKT